MTGQERYELKNKRLDDALAMKEPDMVPLAPQDQTFSFANAGHTMAEGMYDFSVGEESAIKLLEDYDLDLFSGLSTIFCGFGPAFDTMGVKLLQWAGQKDGICDERGVYQYVEKPYLDEEEYPLMLSDLTGFIMRKYLPEILECAKPLADVNFTGMVGFGALLSAAQFANPAIVETFKKLNTAAYQSIDVLTKNAAFEQKIIGMGYPLLIKGTVCTAFDTFSDNFRGTLGISEDLITQPEMVEAAVNMFHPAALATAKMTMGAGKYIMIPLHKGIDMFMSDEHYAKFYWPTLKDLILKIVEAGDVPYILTEGPYYSRLKYLEELPEHSCIITFTDTDMSLVKKTVGRHNCIAGGFNDHLLETGTPEQVAEEVKRLLDICAPGGGYLFGVDRTLDFAAKPENVAAMCEAVRKYGVY